MKEPTTTDARFGCRVHAVREDGARAPRLAPDV